MGIEPTHSCFADSRVSTSPTDHLVDIENVKYLKVIFLFKLSLIIHDMRVFDIYIKGDQSLIGAIL